MNPTLRQGSRGDAVKDLQTRLGITADGIFGTQTAAAVRDFQSKAGIGVDAIVGPQTWGALNQPPPEPQGGGTNPAGGTDGYQPIPYGIGPAPMSTEEIAAINEQKRLAQAAYDRQLSQNIRDEAVLKLSALRAKKSEDRLFNRRVDDQMQEFGGRGVATAPRFAGSMIRRETEDLQLKYGEIDTELGSNIASLQSELARLAYERDIAIAQAEERLARGQSSPTVLFTAPQRYG